VRFFGGEPVEYGLHYSSKEIVIMGVNATYEFHNACGYVTTILYPYDGEPAACAYNNFKPCGDYMDPMKFARTLGGGEYGQMLHGPKGPEGTVGDREYHYEIKGETVFRPFDPENATLKVWKTRSYHHKGEAELLFEGTMAEFLAEKIPEFEERIEQYGREIMGVA
jgi:hypothetical protein